MLNTKMKLASLALAGGLAIAFTGAASAQQWSEPDHAGVTLARYHGIAGHHFYHRGYPYAYDDYYRQGYYGYGPGPLGVAGAIVGAGLGAADTAVVAATGYPYYGYGYGPSTYNGYYNSGWAGPYGGPYYGAW